MCAGLYLYGRLGPVSDLATALPLTMPLACPQEPPKAVQLQYEAGLLTSPPPRQALCVMELPAVNAVVEALVDLTDPGNVLHWHQVRAL